MMTDTHIKLIALFVVTDEFRRDPYPPKTVQCVLCNEVRVSDAYFEDDDGHHVFFCETCRSFLEERPPRRQYSYQVRNRVQKKAYDYYSRKYYLDEDDVQDLTQEACTRLLERIADSDQPPLRNKVGYFKMVLATTLRDHFSDDSPYDPEDFRHLDANSSGLPDEQPSAVTFANPERRAVFRDWLHRTFNDIERPVAELLSEGANQQDVAYLLDTTPSRISRMVRRLRTWVPSRHS